MKGLDTYWIGDQVEIIKTGDVGTYEGSTREGKARIKIHKHIVLLSADEIREYKIEKSKNRKLADLHDEEEKISSFNNTAQLPDSLDLHIERLAPHLSNSLPQIILNYQITKCKAYIQSALDQKYKRFTIIHGKGEGVLKSEVEHLLKDFDRIAYVIPQNDGGAMEVWTK